MYKHSMISCIHKGKQKFKPEILFNIICNIPFHFSFSFFYLFSFLTFLTEFIDEILEILDTSYIQGFNKFVKHF